MRSLPRSVTYATIRESAMPRNVPVSRAAASKSLRRLARRGPVKYDDLEPALRRAVTLHWGTMAAAREALRIAELTPPRQAWSRQRVLDEIRALAKAGAHLSMSAMRDAGRHDLLVAAEKYAGGWTRARVLAGVRFERIKPIQTTTWDAEAVVVEIRHRMRSELPLAVTKSPRSLVSAAIRIFDSWRNAVEAAGIDYERVRLSRTYDDDELLAWLRRLARRHPRMSPFDIDKHGEHAVACRRRWGSYEAAAAAAGLVDWPVRKHNPVPTRREVLRALRARDQAGRPMTVFGVRAEEGGNILIRSALQYFSTWTEALAAARKTERNRSATRRRSKS